MTTNPDNNRATGRWAFNPDSLKLESLKYILLNHWIAENLVEVPSARLPLKTAYLLYAHHCEAEGLPRVPIQAFNRSLVDVSSSCWPKVRRRRTAQGTLYENLTLRGWVPNGDAATPPLL